MKYQDILKANLKSDCFLRLYSVNIDIPMPEQGLVGDLYVAVNPIEESLVFGKKYDKKDLKVTSLFRVKNIEDKEKLELIRSDDPMERSICFNGIEKFKGNVLVLGAGIGVVQGFLEQNKQVKSVLTVEEEKDVCSLIKKSYPNQEFVVQNYNEFFHECSELFDCVYIHPWNSFHYELIPYLNTLVAASITKCITQKIVVWGYAHTVDEYTEACLKILKKAKNNINTIKLGFVETTSLKRSSPMMASCIEFLREEYVRTKTGKWAPKTGEVKKLALETALTSTAR